MPDTRLSDIRSEPLDLRLLRTFVVVVGEGNISRAAQKLYRSQSAISEQLGKLECQLGISLATRNRRGIEPTAAGKRLLTHAKELLALSDLARRDIATAEFEGEIHLGITDYFRPGSIAPMLNQIKTMFPALRLRITITDSASIESGAKSYDIGITMALLSETERERPPLKDKTLYGVPLRVEPLVWTASSSFSMERSATLPLILLDDLCDLRRYVTRRLSASGVDYRVQHEASGVAGIQSAISAGLGVTCLNQSAMTEDMVDVGHLLRLPKMPHVRFSLLPPGAGESKLIGELRHILLGFFQ